MLKAKKCILLDLDNTLINSESIYKEALHDIGIVIHSEEYISAKLAVKTQLGTDHVSSHNRILYFKKYLEMQKKFSPNLILKLNEKYERSLHKYVKFQWRTLKREALINLLSAKYKIGIITNENTRTQLIKLNAMDPHGKLFQEIITSEEVGVEKPSEKIFVHALNCMNAEASECILVGDNLFADIIPAKNMGFSCFLTTEFTAQLTKIDIDAPIIQKLDSLKEILNL